MTLLETLQCHKGSLLRLRSELHWYDREGRDRSSGQTCVLLDVAPYFRMSVSGATATVAARGSGEAVQLLINGSPHWVWVAEGDLEVIE